MRKSEPKGPEMEERLRHYFISLNYFVIRGVKYRFNEVDVTDIDLWLYARTSPLSRERANVDIKNRRTPQALERIFWAKGLQEVLRLDRCIVATTDTRQDVTQFGLRNAVSVLDGRFLSRLQKSEKSHLRRLTEEMFLAEIDGASLGRLGGDWRGRYLRAKSRVLTALNFDGCNAWLNDIRFFIEQALVSGNGSGTAWRLVELCISFLLIAIDFIHRDLVGMDADQRKGHLAEGFRYGEGGKAFTEKLARMATALVGSTMSASGAGEAVRSELEKQTQQIRAELLGDFFARSTVQSTLFDLAREFEQAAFAVVPTLPSAMSTNAQSVTGVIADFLGVDRKRALQRKSLEATPAVETITQ